LKRNGAPFLWNGCAVLAEYAKENDKVSRAKNPKYESMSLEELKANMEKSRQELEVAIHNKNLLEQRKKLVERRERSHRLIVKGAEFEKAFPLSRDLEQEDVQNIMNQLQNSSYNKSIVRQTYISASQKDRQQIAEAVKKTEKGDDS
jgi:Na+-translocating ferredoxin:NAD+ oxidoreductase RnfC subunit